MKKLLITTICILFLFCLCSCNASKTGENATDTRLKIVATIFPQYDFARAIGGDKAGFFLQVFELISALGILIGAMI